MALKIRVRKCLECVVVSYHSATTKKSDLTNLRCCSWDWALCKTVLYLFRLAIYDTEGLTEYKADNNGAPINESIDRSMTYAPITPFIPTFIALQKMGLACRRVYILPFILTIIFSCLFISSSAICLPCQPSSRRSTLGFYF